LTFLQTQEATVLPPVTQELLQAPLLEQPLELQLRHQHLLRPQPWLLRS
jgi:hypothetical protein